MKSGDTSEVAPAASIFLITRVVYVPTYVSGVPILRSLVWLVGVAGLVMLALPLI